MLCGICCRALQTHANAGGIHHDTHPCVHTTTYNPTSTRNTTLPQAFASVERLQQVVGKVNDALHTQLPPLVAKMRLYLPEPSTRAVLFKPIKSNIAEAHAQIAALLEAEYTTEEAGEVGLLDPGQLGGVLDALG